MPYIKIPKEQQKKRGPSVSEAGQTFRVWLKPSVSKKIIDRYGTLTNALLLQYELDLKKDKKVVK